MTTRTLTALILTFGMLVSATPGDEPLTDGEPGPVLESDEGQQLHWDGGIRFVLDAAGTEQLPRDGVESALIEAIGTWQAVDAEGLDLTYTGVREAEIVGYRSSGPNTNLVVFRDDEWMLGDESLAITLSTYVQSTGELLDADILVNSVANTWVLEPSGEGYDLHSALSHEIGHALGLDHATEEGSVMQASLSPGVARREASIGDTLAIAHLYAEGPTEPEPTVVEVVDPVLAAERSVDIDYAAERKEFAACSSGGSGNGWGFAFVALLLLTFRGSEHDGRKHRRVLAAALFAALTVAPAAGFGTTVERVSMSDLVARADHVMRATVVETESRWEGGMIVTTATLSLDACLTDSCPDDGRLVVIGGRIGEIVQTIAGGLELRPGLELLLFARERQGQLTPVGLGQGVFYIDPHREVAIPATEGLRIVDPLLGVARHAIAEPIAIDTLIERVQTEISLP